jgi:hypothetical protein
MGNFNEILGGQAGWAAEGIMTRGRGNGASRISPNMEPAAGLWKIREVNHGQLLRPTISPRIAPSYDVVQVDFAEPCPAFIRDTKGQTAGRQHQVQGALETGLCGNRPGGARLAGFH